jgi:hypothetical protein
MPEITRWTKHEDELVEKIVDNWNIIVAQVENQTIKFAVVLNEFLSAYPESTAKEIINRVKNHPKIKMTISRDRIYQGWRLIKNRPDIAKCILEYTPEQLNELPPEKQPIRKKDGSVAVEHYFELYKRPGQIDEGMKVYLESEAKKNYWTVAELKEKIAEATAKVNQPDNTKIEKGDLMRSITGLCRRLNNIQLRGVKSFIEELLKDGEEA